MIQLIYRPYSNFISCLRNVLFLNQDPKSGSQCYQVAITLQFSSICNNLLIFFCVCVSFMILEFLKGTGQLFCIMFSKLGLYNIFSCSCSGFTFLPRILFSVHHIRGCVMSMCAVNDDVNADHMAKVTGRFLHSEVIAFPLLLISISQE